MSLSKKIRWLLPPLAIVLAGVPASFAQGPIDYTRDPDPEYDRFDGHGPSGKKVQVHEWEGNLEIHVYPKGSLVGLGLKLDERNKAKKVMVISYRFDNDPKKTHVRRALVSIPFLPQFRAYRDPGADDYDKIIVTNHVLAAGAVFPYKLDAEPTQLYPDGHPALAEKKDDAPSRAPAKDSGSGNNVTPLQMPKGEIDPETGTIRPFHW